MTRLTSEMLELLEGRIAFRRQWVLRNAPAKQTVHVHTFAWERAYDEEFNFAHMGARYIDDEEWGKPKPAKPRAKKKSDFIKASFVLATARALQSEAAE